MSRQQPPIEPNPECLDASCGYLASIQLEVDQQGAFDSIGVTLQERRRVDACLISRTCFGRPGECMIPLILGVC